MEALSKTGGAYYCVPDGAGGQLSLYVECQGCGSPLLLLHGFTGSGRNLGELAAALAMDFTVYRVDLVGHGRSGAPQRAQAYRMENCVAQLLALLDQLGLDTPHWLGYSMGARVVLSLCAAYPERLCSGLLVGVSPGIDEPRARARRVLADRRRARRLLAGGLEAFVDEWMQQPLFASQHRLGAQHWRDLRAQRMDNKPEALAGSLRGMGTGAMEPLQRQLASIESRLCLVTGQWDTRFTAVARTLLQQLAGAELHVVPAAGHAVHLERPDILAILARTFFLRTEVRTGG